MRGAAQRLAVLTLAIGLAGCWFQPGADAERSGYAAFEDGITAANVAQLHEVWSRTLGGKVPSPAVGPDGVYATTGWSVAGALTLIDPTNGSTRWSAPLFAAGSSYSALPPTIHGGIAYVPVVGISHIQTTDIRRIDATTGQVLTPLAEQSTIGPAIGRDDYLVGTSGRAVPNLGLFTRLFVHRPGGTGSWGRGLYTGSYDGPIPTPVAVAGDRVVFGNGEAVDAYPLDNTSCPLVNGKKICDSLWSTPLSADVTGHPVLSADDATVFAASGDALVVLDAGDGAKQWTGELGATASAAPAVANGYVYVPTTAGLDVFAAAGCGASTCAPLWTATTGSDVDQPPAVTSGGLVYVALSDEHVAAFSATGCGTAICTSLWSVEVGAGITGGPVPALGKVFVGTDDGRLIAYGI